MNGKLLISELGRALGIDLIDKVLGGKIEKGIEFVTDSFRGYNRLSYDTEVDHIRIKPKKHTEGPFNIQLLNSYHSQLKRMVNGKFRGVFTKYLNNYLIYHNLGTSAKEQRASRKRRCSSSRFPQNALAVMVIFRSGLSYHCFSQ